MSENYVIYRGTFFTIEWYFDERGKSKVQKYFDDLSVEQKKKILRLFRLLADMGKIHNDEKFRYEGNQIYAFKPSPDREKALALRARESYVNRFKTGKYYV